MLNKVSVKDYRSHVIVFCMLLSTGCKY